MLSTMTPGSIANQYTRSELTRSTPDCWRCSRRSNDVLSTLACRTTAESLCPAKPFVLSSTGFITSAPSGKSTVCQSLPTPSV